MAILVAVVPAWAHYQDLPRMPWAFILNTQRLYATSRTPIFNIQIPVLIQHEVIN